MKIISAIAIGIFFLFLEFLKINGKTTFGYYSLFGVEEMGGASFAWITDLINALLIIPEAIFSNNKDFFIHIFSKIYEGFSQTHILSLIIFIYYFLFSYISSFFLKFIKLDRDKKFYVFLIISIYLILIKFLS